MNSLNYATYLPKFGHIIIMRYPDCELRLQVFCGSYPTNKLVFHLSLSSVYHQCIPTLVFNWFSVPGFDFGFVSSEYLLLQTL